MTSISKNLYIDKLDDIVDKYNNEYDSTIKKPIVVNSSTYINSSKEIKILNLKDTKLLIKLEYQNIKTFCKRIHSELVCRNVYDLKM